MKLKNGQVLVEYILLTLLVVVATVAVVKFIVQEVFGKSMGDLRQKTSNCISTSKKDDCK